MAKTSAGASSSTEPAAEPRAPGAWPFEQVPPALVTAFAQREGLRAGGVASATAAVRAHLDDRDRIRDTLRRLSPLALVVLEILAELGGRAGHEVLFHLVHARTGRDAAAAGAALRDLDARLLTTALVTKPARGEGRHIAALLAPGAEHVAALVSGVSLPPSEPPPDARAAPAASSRRDVLAVAGLTGHRVLRFNHDGSPNGSQLPRFGKGLATPDVRIDALLDEARRRGLLGAIGDAYAPIAGALLGFAAEVDDEMAAWLPASGWTLVEAIERAVVRSTIDQERAGMVMGAAEVYRGLADDAARRVGRASGVEIVEAGGHAWIRRRSDGPGGGDGHVTPSFDVMLGPGADLGIVATIALGCELTRIDRVLTFRITPASVVAGLSSGLPAASLVGALDRVGRHPLPSNVRAMVDDWIARHKPATITRAWLVRLPGAVADAVAASDLGKSILDRPAPGVLAIDPSLRRADLVKLLGKHGVSLGPPLTLEEAVAHREEERFGPDGTWRARYDARHPAPKALVRRLPLPLRFEGDPLLAEKVAAARAAGFPLEAAVPAPSARAPKPAPAPGPASPPPRIAPPAVPAEPPPRAAVVAGAMLDAARAAGLSREIVAGLVSLGAMYVEELPELERWAAHLPPATRAGLRETFESPLALAAFLVLAPKARQTVLGKARDLDRLLGESSRSRDLGRVSPRGAAAVPLVAQAERALAARRAAPGAPAERAAAAPARHPAPLLTDFRQQSAEEVLALLRAACIASAPVRLLVRSADGLAVHDVIPSAIHPRGAASALLAIDPETDEGRVFHVPDVLAVEEPPSPSLMEPTGRARR